MRDFQLDSWLVEPSLNQIRRSDEVRRLGSRVMGLLVCLADRGGLAVTKDELVEEVWEGQVTTDEVLTTAVYELRKALDDDARNPRFVGTVRGRGYRLLCAVEAVGPRASASVSTDGALDPADPPRPSGAVDRGRGRLWGALALAGLLSASLLWLRPEPTSPPTDAEPRALGSSSPIEPSAARDGRIGSYTLEPRPVCSLVVLPLAARDPDPDGAVFAQGLSEQLAMDLARGSSLAVIPGYSSVLDGRSSSELGSDAVVEGSVQRAGNRLWTRLQMVDSTDGRLLWGGTWEHTVDDGFDLQRRLAREIAGQILEVFEPSEGCEPGPIAGEPGTGVDHD